MEFGLPFMDLDALVVDPETVRLVPARLLAKHRVLPLFRRGKHLFVGINDPTAQHAIDEIKFQTGLFVELIIVDDHKLQARLDRVLEATDNTLAELIGEESRMAFDTTGSASAAAGTADEAQREDPQDAPVVRFVNTVLRDAIRRGASDIHFEPFEQLYRVRLRIDGVLREIARPPVTLASRISARLKVLARLDIAERRVPQDGRMKMRLSGTHAIDLRVSSCPTMFGEKIVLRILDPTVAQLGIDALGFEPHQKALYLRNLARPQGMILVTGPTGSGKTVSLYTGLSILNTADSNISTAEDPVEINLPGINQVNVNNRVGLTFAAALRAFLRQDPDVIMVGEIRDLETAEIAMKAAETGHLVLSTLHTNDAPQTLTRLIDMGVRPFAIANSVSLIIAQRLARRLCTACKEPLQVPDDTLLQEGFEAADLPTPQIYGARGCAHCVDGYKGRIGIYQVMPITEAIGRIIMSGGHALDIAAQSRQEGVWDLRRASLEKVKAGLTSLSEINSVTIE